MNQKPWYSDGLNFKCTGCGQCCTGSPGYVWVTENEIETIANHLKMSLDEFKKVHTRLVDGRYSLNEKSNYDCVFLKEKKCTIYEVRPVQCQTFPWWPGNLQSKERWNSAAASCEGISPSAPKVNFNVIQDGLRRYENNQ